jgi:hypothetical protein
LASHGERLKFLMLARPSSALSNTEHLLTAPDIDGVRARPW